MLFGGYRLESGVWTHFNDTYTVTADGVWKRITARGAVPPPRFAAAGIYDPVGERLIIFGGTYQGITHYNDTRALDLDTGEWSLLATTGTVPEERRNHTAVYDSARRRMIVFGGLDSTDQKVYYNDMHALALDTLEWSEITLSTGTLPSRRAHTAEYSVALDAVVLFGGDDDSAEYNDVIIYSCATGAASWLQTAGQPHPTTIGAASLLDPSTHRLFLFGGFDGQTQYNILSTIDLVTGVWERVETGSNSPAPRHWTPLARVGGANAALLFGGLSAGNQRLNDTWRMQTGELSARRWTHY